MPKDKRSFFERLTGAVKIEHDEDEDLDYSEREDTRLPATIHRESRQQTESEWIEEAAEEGQLTVDVYQTPNDIVIKTIVAGLRPEDLDISISRDMVTIKGKREETREVSEDDYFHKELYWGAFSRTVLLPEEIDVEEAEASEKHGLLTITLPKIDKRRQTKLKVKSS
jgi:HSP20 family molecular chaperone IbpA